MFKKNKNKKISQLEVSNRPKSIISEQFRTLRTNILFTSSDKKLSKIMITSSEPGEGKSTVSANVAIAFAQAGYKTILIDADMRKPTQHKIFSLTNSAGLSNLIAGRMGLNDVLKDTGIENLHLLTSGPVPPNPAELLGSMSMLKNINELEKITDMIIIDISPVLAVTDSKIIGNIVDGCLLVVNAQRASKEKVITAKNELLKSECNILGVALNELSNNDSDSNYYYYGEKSNDSL
ncbi:CpsD/CapB family tyrosine-protein kinase [Macrococcus brunensis]|uniref:CpsD/CapB family tyrosine-protein kinase n=1 Tax=Macrococcus brunensis TaxID=198483 RepID=UPI001EEF88F2|nr:CpsD/CapB family tyrosine-protein kinase [Macrococcus brunensis]ULG72695.1 CpsD/CapB family tyrosine-protein kinase [Macrococcus brunensis]